jgi:quinol---cytochrome c reductase iron-sulfur subunit, bacillus type
VAAARKEPKSKYTSDRLMPGSFEGESVTRRRFMTLTAHGAGAFAAAAFTLPPLAFAIGSPIFDAPAVRWEDVGKLDDFPNNAYVPRVITMTTSIGEVGKTTVYLRRRNDDIDPPPNPPGYSEPVVAISTRCMHLGCPVRYVQASSRFICPCHGGVYDFAGKVVGGPPVRPLDRFYTRVRGDRVEVGPRYSVNSELKRFDKYRDPAQDLDGIGKYLYPPRPSVPTLPKPPS